MKIGVVRYRKKTCHFKLEHATGMDSFCNMFGGCIYNHVDAIGMDFDCVFLMGDPRTMKWYRENGRPERWKKVVWMNYISPIETNDTNVLADITAAKVDGYCLTDQEYCDFFKIFNKPIIKCNIPYLFLDKYSAKKENKACLVIKNMSDVKINYLATLAVFKAVPNLKGIVALNPAFPYCDDTGRLKALVRSIGLADRLEVISPKSNRGDYLKAIASCKVMINMDMRLAMNRNTLDAVETGMHCVGAYSIYQEIFYKDLMVECYNIGYAIDNVKVALTLPPYVATEENKNMFDVDYIKGKLIEDIKKI